MKRYVAWAWVVALLLAAVPAFEVLAAEEPSPQELVVRITGVISNLDPAYFSLLQDYEVASNIYSALVKYDPATMEILPDLAESWDVSSDGKTYTFHLRQNVSWQKGFGPFTAADVKYSYDRILDPDTASRHQSQLLSLASVEVVDDYAVRFHLNYPYAPFIHIVAGQRAAQGFITNQQAVEQFGDDYPMHPIGTGPFELEAWEGKEKVILKANPDYFLGPPQLNRVTFLQIIEDTVAQLALENGEIDAAFISSPEAVVRYRDDDRFAVHEAGSMTTTMISFNTTEPPFDNIDVRKAVAHAVNKQDIVDYVWGGMGRVSDNPVLPECFGYTDTVAKYAYDPARARALLAQAGHPGGLDVDWVISPWFGNSATAISEMLRQVGIRANVLQMDGAGWSAAIKSGDPLMSYMATTRPPDPDSLLTTMFHSSNFPPGYNLMRYDKVDAQLDEARESTDTERRRELYGEAQRLIMEDVAVVPLFQTAIAVVVHNHVKGHVTDPLWGFTLYPISIEP